MTLPAFSAAGTGSETAPAWPTHAAGDFGILLVETASGAIATPAGWTKVTQLDHGLTSLAMFYRFATSGAEGAPSLSGGFNHLWGVILTWTGVNTATPIHGLSVSPAVSTTSQALPGTRPFLDDCRIVQACGWALDSAGPISSGETNAVLGSLTERYDAGTITGNGGGIIVLDGTLATAQSVPPTSITLSAASALACITVALQAADKILPTLANKSRAVNTGM